MQKIIEGRDSEVISLYVIPNMNMHKLPGLRFCLRGLILDKSLLQFMFENISFLWKVPLEAVDLLVLGDSTVSSFTG